ncbi:MAG: glycosyl transferase [Anaerolineae bacterium]|jgi:glycosyltransferase involved in cell wall biosynthesis|nr:MAG: glycosyl transferase [Anaerolineae bacterium]
MKKEPNKLISLFLADLGGGGAERAMVNLANGIAQRGWIVHLVLAKKKGVYFEEVNPNVKIIDLGAKRTLTAIFPLIRYLKHYCPDVLISALEHANLVAIWAKYLSRTRPQTVVSVRVVVSHAYQDYYLRRFRLIPRLVTLFYPLSDQIVAVSKDVAKDLVENFGLRESKIHVIYNPNVHPEIFVKSEAKLNHPWFVNKKQAIVLGIGRLDPQKDFPTLLRAFQRVLQQKEARLVILGEGPERSNLLNLIDELGLQGKVDLPGFDPNPFPYLKQADVFVLSSRFEGLPGVLIQAMALGTPVIATDCPGGVREILEDGKWGAIVPVGDAAKMAEKIMQGLQGNLPIPTQRGRQFSVEQAVSDYLNLLGLS